MSELRSIDVAVATLNSERTLDRCLGSIRKYVPVGRLIVIDGGSVDSTLQIAERHAARIFHEPSRLLGRVRLRQAELSDTEWMGVIDSDVYVYPGWFAGLSSYVNEHIGMISAFADSPKPSFRVYHDYLLWNSLLEGNVTFSNTLVRRDLILSCREELMRTHAGEDEVVARKARGRGLLVVTVREYLAFHDRDAVSTNPLAYVRNGQSIRVKFGLVMSLKFTLSAYVAHLRKWLRFTLGAKRFSLSLLLYLFALVTFQLHAVLGPRPRPVISASPQPVPRGQYNLTEY